MDGEQQVGMAIMKEEEYGSATTEIIEKKSCAKDTGEDRNREEGRDELAKKIRAG